jgi:PTH1 family peptidyl-tRNA hydrolase
MYLIVGLGNPGEKYSKTRHNVGFIVLDEIVHDQWVKDKYAEAMISFQEFSNKEVVFIKPFNFMNNSGISVRHFQEKKNIPVENIVVVHDDIDLPFGTMRVSFGASAGGHNGIRSIIDNLNTNKFLRIRIGIAPTDSEGKAMKPKGGFLTSAKKAVGNFVLKDFSSGDLDKIKTLKEKVKEVIDIVIKEGREKAMNKFN